MGRRGGELWGAESGSEPFGAIFAEERSGSGDAGGGVFGEVGGNGGGDDWRAEGGGSICPAGCGVPGGATGVDDGRCGDKNRNNESGIARSPVHYGNSVRMLRRD